MIDHPNPRQVLESAIYGAAGIAQHEGVTQLLLEYGADPNDEELRTMPQKDTTMPC